MTKFEALKRKYLLFALDDEFDLMSIHSSVCGRFYYENEKQIKKIIRDELYSLIIDFIKYLLDSKFFIISGNVNGIELYNLSQNEILTVVKNIIKKNEEHLYWIVFNLTNEGIEEAKKYLLKQIHADEKILLNGENHQKLSSVIKIIKNEFHTNDLEEIQYETLNSINGLIDNQYIEIGDLKDNLFFVKWNYISSDYQARIKYELKKINTIIDFDVNIYYRNTPATNALIEKWQECGGRLINKWYYYIDNF